MNADEKYCDLANTSNYSKNDSLLTNMYTKYTYISYIKEWVDVYSWHIYRPFLNGRLCKTCVLFDILDARNRRTFVKETFSEPHLTRKIAEHNCLHCHNDVMEKARKFQDTYEARHKDVHYNPKENI